jgi:hypothetical protein
MAGQVRWRYATSRVLPVGDVPQKWLPPARRNVVPRWPQYQEVHFPIAISGSEISILYSMLDIDLGSRHLCELSQK